MPKNFQTLVYDSTSPGFDSVPIDVSGGNVTPTEPFRAIRATAAGNVVVDTQLGTSRTMAIGAGETRPMIITRIYQSGTTATGLEGIV
jgi:hypothetical protein